MYINKASRDEIKELVHECEKRTDCDIVPMIIAKAHNYPSAHYIVGILLSLIFSIGLYLSPISFINPIFYIWSIISGIFIGFYLGHIPFIKRFFIHKNQINHEVYMKSCEAFLHHNLHLTKDHLGVLILVSVFERKIQIVCDRTINDKIDQKIWDEVISHFISISKKQDITKALKETIIKASEILAIHFPAHPGKSHELKDDLIIEQ